MEHGEWYLGPGVPNMHGGLVPGCLVPPSPQAQTALHAVQVRWFVLVDEKVDSWQRPVKTFLGQVGVGLSIERTEDIPYFQPVGRSDPRSVP